MLLIDKEVAKLFGLSPSWVRVQRHKRLKGESHIFTVDPIYIGRSARYREDEVQAWYRQLKGTTPNTSPPDNSPQATLLAPTPTPNQGGTTANAAPAARNVRDHIFDD